MILLKEFSYNGRKVQIGEQKNLVPSVPAGDYTMDRVYLIDGRPLHPMLIYAEFADIDKAEIAIKEYIDTGDI